MNIDNIGLWGYVEAPKEHVEGLCFLRQLIKHFRRNRREILLTCEELRRFIRNPNRIPKRWFGHRIYSLNPKSFFKCKKDGEVYCFCLNLLNEGEVKYSFQALVNLHFDTKDRVAYKIE